MPTQDCLICFGTVRRREISWKQPLPVPCECRPVVHEACWRSWAERAGPVCIICRSDHRPRELLIEIRAHRPLALQLVFVLERISVYVAFCVLIMFLVNFMTDSRRGLHPHPHPHPWELQRDEL